MNFQDTVGITLLSSKIGSILNIAPHTLTMNMALYLLIIFILVTLERYEHRLNIGQESKIVRVKVCGIIDTQRGYTEIFKRHGIHVQDEYLKFDYGQDFTIINYVILTKEGVDFASLFKEIHNERATLSITLTNEVNI